MRQIITDIITNEYYNLNNNAIFATKELFYYSF